MATLSDLRETALIIARAVDCPPEVVALVEGAADAEALCIAIAAVQAHAADEDDKLAAGMAQFGSAKTAAVWRSQARLARSEWERMMRVAGLR